MTAMRALRRPLFVAALVGLALVLSGCPSTPRRGGVPSVDRAEQLIRAGDQAAAAAVYERLASETSGTDAIEFNLRAARAWLAAGRAADADRVLAAIPAGGTQQQTLELNLLRIQSRLAQGQGDQA